jgi:hypothetical protein
MLFDSNQSTKVVYNCENHNITRDVYLWSSIEIQAG